VTIRRGGGQRDDKNTNHSMVPFRNSIPVQLRNVNEDKIIKRCANVIIFKLSAV